MPVKKYHSVEEVPEPWYTPGDPALFQAIHRVWSLGSATLQPRFPPGVHRHRSIEEMNQLDDAWDEANFLAFQARRASEKRHLDESPEEGGEPALPTLRRR